jgi:hypothetical protein
MEVNFLWPAMSKVEDGRIVVRATGYTNEYHWTGTRTVGLQSDPFWAWWFANRKLFPPILDECFLPGLRRFWLNEITTDASAPQVLPAPADANYISLQFLTPQGQDACLALFHRYGQNAFLSLSDALESPLTLKLLAQFCRGMSEVFCFRAGECAYFAAPGEHLDQLDLQYKLLDKRIPRRPPA